MNTNTIPTAEKFFEQGGTYPELAIEFAKLHVQAAVEAAYQLSRTKWVAGESGIPREEDVKLIYPLTNIK